MPTQHTVRQGDCFSSIAAQYGFPWKMLWNHPDNAQLNQLRKDPSVLFPGDVVSIPDKDVKEESRPTDAHHKFTKKAEPTHIRVRLLMDDKPRAGLKYELQVTGDPITGSTDGDGFLEADIPPDATHGTLVAGDGASRSVYYLEFGALDPIDTEEGVRKRLESLGYDTEEDLADAVQGFQTKEGLAVTGTIDDTLRAKLKEKFGQ
jgi:N-acetylmuramoyl-L-alanine amidase